MDLKPKCRRKSERGAFALLSCLHILIQSSSYCGQKAVGVVNKWERTLSTCCASSSIESIPEAS